ncbi:MAG: hypothetical protein AAF570_15850, partial [Bacteroidota bacterium]
MAFSGCPVTEGGVAGSPKKIGESKVEDKELRYEDYVYEDYVRTVQFHRGENPLSYPILFLNEPTQLTLAFDALIS